jgi:hypothetical protein
MGDAEDIERYLRLAEDAEAARRHADGLLFQGAHALVLTEAQAKAEGLEGMRQRASRQLALQHAASQVGSKSPPARHASRRDQVGASLGLLRAASRTVEVIDAVDALGGLPLTPADLVQLRREERRQWTRARQPQTSAVERPWYIAPALSADTLAPARGVYALSSWPIRDRLVTPVASRLWATRAAANVARAVAEDPEQHDPRLRKLLDRLAQSAPVEGGRWLSGAYGTGKSLFLMGDPLQATYTFSGGAGTRGSSSFLARLVELAQQAEDEAVPLAAQHAEMTAEAERRADRLSEHDSSIAIWGAHRPDGTA